MLVAQEMIAVAILRIRIAAEVHAAPQLACAGDDRNQLIEIVSLDHGIEADPGDAIRAHLWDRAHDLRAQSRNSAGLVVALVQKIERDVELVDPRFPQ